MPRVWIPLLLVLVAGAAVVLWPQSEADPGLVAQSEAGGEDEERGPVDAEFLPENDGGPAQPEVSEATDPQREGGEVLVASPGVADPDGEAFVLVQIVDENGGPMQGATVGVLAVPDINDDNLQDLQPILFTVQGAPVKDFDSTEALTDVEGRVRLPAPLDAQLVVYARMPRHLISFQLRPPMSAGEEADLGQMRLAPGGYLQVQVIDEFGGPVVDAAVVAVLNDGGNFAEELPIHFLRSDENGKAVFNHLSFKEYKIEVAKHGYRYFREDPVAITQRGDGMLEVTLSRGAVMSGTVIDAFGGPAEGVNVSVDPRNNRHEPEGLTRGLLGARPPTLTDAGGAFRIEGLFEEGEYNLVARPSRGLPYFSREKPAEGLTLQLPETAFVRGRVVQADGEAAVQAQIGFIEDVGNQRRRPRTRSFRTDETGAFEAQLPPGEYSWYIRHNSGEAASDGFLNFTGSYELGDLMLRAGGTIELRFVDASGKATGRVNYQSIRRIDSGAESESRSLANARRPRQRGSYTPFVMQGLTHGRYQLRFTASDGLVPLIEVQVQAGVTTELEIGLQLAAKLTLDVRTPEGERAEGRYRLERKDPLPAEWSHTPATRRIRLRSREAANLNGMVPGTYVLRKDERGSQPFAEFTLQAGSQEREFVLN